MFGFFAVFQVANQLEQLIPMVMRKNPIYQNVASRHFLLDAHAGWALSWLGILRRWQPLPASFAENSATILADRRFGYFPLRLEWIVNDCIHDLKVLAWPETGR